MGSEEQRDIGSEEERDMRVKEDKGREEESFEWATKFEKNLWEKIKSKVCVAV